MGQRSAIEIIGVCNDTTPIDENHPLKNQFPEVQWLHEPNKGSAFARNTGWTHASGEWIQFLDVDDILLPGKIHHQLPADHDSVVVSPHLFSFTDGRTEKSKWLADDLWTGILGSGLGSTSSMLWSKDALQKAGGWSTTYQSHQEYELLSRMAMMGIKVHFVDRVETIVRQRLSGSITQATSHVRPMEGILLREHIWNYLIANELETPGRKEAFLQYIFRQLRGLYVTDAHEALRIYEKYFKGTSFTPRVEGIWGYGSLYHLFGFNGSEKMMRAYRKLRENYLPFLPKNK